MDAAAAYAAATSFEREAYVRGASATAHPLGLVIGGHDVPRAHIANMLWVTAAEATPRELVTALDDAFGHLSHRKAQVDDDALGARLAAPMRERGFEAERHLYLALQRPRDREPEPGLARETDAASHADVEAATTREFPHGKDEEVVRQLARARAAIRIATPTRYFVGDADGVTASHATLLARDGVAQVEDVATLTAQRGRGLARAVCSAAVDAAAGAEVVFIVADDGDWPKELYRKLGFDSVGAAWAFVRDPA